MTRAKTFLYLTHTLSRMQGGAASCWSRSCDLTKSLGMTVDASLSQFVAGLLSGKQKAGTETEALFSQTAPQVSAEHRINITSILGRPAVAEDKVKDALKI